MAYTDLVFFLFFFIVAVVYFVCPRKLRPFCLLTASYAFIFKWSIKSAVFTIAVTLLTYLSAIAVEKIYSRDNSEESLKKQKTKAKAVMSLCAVLLFGVLFAMKYSPLFINTTVKAINVFGGNISFEFPDIVMPIGLSFYIFASMGYVIDVYNKKRNAEKNIIRYSLFVSFFPNYTSGPIERSDNLLSQIEKIYNINLWNYERVASGFITALWGFFLKLVIADRAAVLVNTVFSGFWRFGSTELLLGAIVFSIQIYGDFAGGSYIALGLAKVLGFDLIDNFKSPYFSKSIKEFWRRWHISLSSWFKDYLYIPLGGNRKGSARKYLNMLIVFLVCGIWHGANWTFLIWGLLHGAYQFVGGVTSDKRNMLYKKAGIKTDSTAFNTLKTLCTFLITAFAWILFRAESLRTGFIYIFRMFTNINIWNAMNGSVYELGLDVTEMNILFVAVAVMFIVDFFKYRTDRSLVQLLKEQQFWVRAGFVTAVFIAVIVFGCYGNRFGAQSFIYADF